MSSFPWQVSIAFWAALSSLISTNPKPRAWPVKRSLMTVTESTVTPASAKRFWTSVSFAPYGRFPPKSFFTGALLTVTGDDRTADEGQADGNRTSEPSHD